MGSCGGIFGITFEDGSSRLPMVIWECPLCGDRDIGFELMGNQKVPQSHTDILLLAKNFYTSKHRYTKDGKLKKIK